MDKLTGGDAPLALECNNALPALSARAVAEADAKLTPLRTQVAVGRAADLTLNRRSWMQDGSRAWQPAKTDKRIVLQA